MVVGYEGDRELGRHVVLVALAVSILGTFVWGLSGAMGVFAGTSGLSARVPPPQADPLVSIGAASPYEPVIERQLVAEEAMEPEPEPPSTGVSADLYQLVADLRDDGIPGNALTALWRLPEVGEAAVPFLEPALVSWDAQQRLLAAFVLRRIGGTPSDALLEVSVESLRSDLPVDVIRTLGSDTRTGATLFLAEHADRARPWLAAGLSSNDAQQRFLCGFLLARDGAREFVGPVSWELMSHLRDNNIRGDAVYSAHALHGFGTHVLPYLRAARSGADRQMSQLLDLIERDILTPPKDSEEIARRGKLHDVTHLYVDPVLELALGRPPVPRMGSW